MGFGSKLGIDEVGTVSAVIRQIEGLLLLETWPAIAFKLLSFIVVKTGV